jgi:hypothetical protein
VSRRVFLFYCPTRRLTHFQSYVCISLRTLRKGGTQRIVFVLVLSTTRLGACEALWFWQNPSH